MKLAVVQLESEHTTIVNTEQITYLREDFYGTSIHFTSGEHIVCPENIDTVVAKLKGQQTVESMLIRVE